MKWTLSVVFAKMDWKLHSSLRIVHQSERPASWFDSRMPWNVLEWMIEPWIIIHHCTQQKIIYESNSSWLNTIILSEKICIRNNGYNFWARNFIGKIFDPLCQLFSIRLWNQAWFDGLERLPRTIGSSSDHRIADHRQAKIDLNRSKRDTIDQKLWSIL